MTTNRPAAPYILSRDDVYALTRADQVSFNTNHGASYIRATLVSPGAQPRIYRTNEQRVFPEQRESGDRTRRIACGTNVYGFAVGNERAWAHDTAPAVVCHAMVHSARHHPVWQTVAGLIKPGDLLTLSWIADRATVAADHYDLHHDTLSLVIHRDTGRLDFLLIADVGEDNRMRMVRRHG